jgi:hypothetical protein
MACSAAIASRARRATADLRRGATPRLSKGNPRELIESSIPTYAALQTLGQLAPVWRCHVVVIDRFIVLTIPIPASALGIFRSGLKLFLGHVQTIAAIRYENELCH